jgi:hypothetical protein
MRFPTTVVLCGLVLASLGCQRYGDAPGKALAKPRVLQVEGVFVHEPSGMEFPASLGDFRRVQVKQYDADGGDVGVEYNLVAPGRMVAATVFVYPSPPCSSAGSRESSVRKMMDTLADREFEQCKAEILRAYPDGRVLSEGPFELDKGGTPRKGRRAAFEYTMAWGPAASELDLFCYVGDRWSIKYRFTHPKHLDGKADIRAFLDGLPWTVTGDGK